MPYHCIVGCCNIVFCFLHVNILFHIMYFWIIYNLSAFLLFLPWNYCKSYCMCGLLHSVQKGVLIFNNICGLFQGAEKGEKKDCNYEQFHVSHSHIQNTLFSIYRRGRCRGTILDTPPPEKTLYCVAAPKYGPISVASGNEECVKDGAFTDHSPLVVRSLLSLFF